MVNISKRTLIIFSIIIFCMLGITTCSIKSCISNKHTYNNNIIALTDTIKYWKDKSGNLISQKTILNGDINNLKLINDSLYNIIKNNIKIKNPDNVVYISTIIKDLQHDTIWKINNDSALYNNKIEKQFDFSDKYRTLKGYTYLIKSNNNIDTLGTKITSNEMSVDFSIIQKDNQLYISSNNPYIKYNNIIGINNYNNTNIKNKRFGIGPYIGVGINYKGQIQPTIGIGLSYSIFKF